MLKMPNKEVKICSSCNIKILLTSLYINKQQSNNIYTEPGTITHNECFYFWSLHRSFHLHWTSLRNVGLLHLPGRTVFTIFILIGPYSLVTSHNSHHSSTQLSPDQRYNQPEWLKTPVWMSWAFKQNLLLIHLYFYFSKIWMLDLSLLKKVFIKKKFLPQYHKHSNVCNCHTHLTNNLN